jgi:hypothetical protein
VVPEQEAKPQSPAKKQDTSNKKRKGKLEEAVEA